MDVVFEIEPPWTEIPPACVPLRPKRFVRARVVCFSIRVKAGETSIPSVYRILKNLLHCFEKTIFRLSGLWETEVHQLR